MRLLILPAVGALTLTISLVGVVPVHAQSAPAAAPAAAPHAAPAVAADPADVGSVDAIIRAMYASISGPKGAPRDWARFRTLFGPNARMIYTAVTPERNAVLRNWSIEEYIAAAGPGLMANGFFEREIGRSTNTFGNVTTIMSAYDSRFTLADVKPFQRGVNSIQLFNAGTRWYILSVMWDSERDGNPIPAALLTPDR